MAFFQPEHADDGRSTKGGFMSPRDLPARPSLDHLKNEAKALLKAFDAGDASARQRIRDTLGETPTLKLTDAQRAVARDYGFPTWAMLRAHVQSLGGVGQAVEAFLAAVQQQDADGARRVLDTEPRIASQSLHVAATLGRADFVRQLVDDDPSQVAEKAGNPPGEPLLYLGYSPFHGESSERDAGLLASAQVLLDAGADPNTKDARYNVPVLHAVTGMRSVLPIARLLLDAGANPTDGESVFHAAEKFHEDALELLLGRGADLNFVGDWGNTALYFLLRWYDIEKEQQVKQGFRWLLDHGADPNVRSGRQSETALQIAARRGQNSAIIQMLLDYRADVNARRGDGPTAWLLARRAGFDEIATVLERAGAEPEPLTAKDLLLAACGRGDRDQARRLSSPELIAALEPDDKMLLPEAAASDRVATAEAYLAAGFPVDTTEESGATALHYMALRGRTDAARALLKAGANLEIRDREHSSTPLGWACWGADFIRAEGADYEGTVRALLEAGARPNSDGPPAQHEGVKRVFALFEASD
jgi:ankyrin repeat protein